MLFRPRTDEENMFNELFRNRSLLHVYGDFILQESDRNLEQFLASTESGRYKDAATIGLYLVKAQAALDTREILTDARNSETEVLYGKNHGIIPPFDICTRGAYRQQVESARQYKNSTRRPNRRGDHLDLHTVDQETLRLAIRDNSLFYLNNVLTSFEKHQKTLDHKRARPVLAWFGRLIGSQLPPRRINYRDSKQ